MEDVGDHGLVHPVPSLQHALGQVRYRAAVAELKGHKGGEAGWKETLIKNKTKTRFCRRAGRLLFLGQLGEGPARNPRAGTSAVRGLIYAAMTQQDKY